MSDQQQPYHPQGQPDPYGQPAPYGQAAPYGAPPRKDNTLLWVLVTITVMIFLCCCGVLGIFGWAGWVAQDEVRSAVSSVSEQAEEAQGAPVVEGEGVSVDGGLVSAGWRIAEGERGYVPVDVTVTNDGEHPQSFSFYVNFRRDGVEIDDSLCTTPTIEPGGTGPARCRETVDAVDAVAYDALTISDY